MSATQRLRMVYCHYRRAWVPMGKARTRRPVCGAVVGDSIHPVEWREAER